MVGFTPYESVVVVPVREDGSVGAVLRADRDDLLSRGGPQIAREMAFHAARESARLVLAVAYTECAVRWGCRALDRVREAMRDTVESVEVWAVTGDRYFSPGCDVEQCCPAGGRPVPGTPAPTFAPEPAAPEDRRRATRAAQRWMRSARAASDARRADALKAWRDALWSGPGDPPALGRLGAALGDVRVRDAALISLIPGAEAAVDDALDGRDSPAIEAALGAGLRPGRAPADGDLEDAVHLLIEVLRHADGGRAAPPAAMLGVLAWWQGEELAARAWCLLALDADPGYRLALLVLALIETHPGRNLAET